MARLFVPFGLCAECAQLTRHASPLLTPRGSGARAKSVFLQQQKRFIGGTNTDFFRYRSKSRIWIWGVGVGVAVAVGLKYCTDTADSPCDDKVTEAQRTDRYSGAVKVSRDLVERIKVGTEVGQETVNLSLAFTFLFIWPATVYATCMSLVCVVCQAEVGAPGMVVGVSVDGAQVWCEGWYGWVLGPLYPSLHGATSVVVQFQDT